MFQQPINTDNPLTEKQWQTVYNLFERCLKDGTLTKSSMFIFCDCYTGDFWQKRKLKKTIRAILDGVM